MAFVPIEKVTRTIPNKYEAVLVAAKDARVQNSIAQLQDLDPNEAYPKMTTMALQRLIDGRVQYFYGEEEPQAEVMEAEELDLDEDA